MHTAGEGVADVVSVAARVPVPRVDSHPDETCQRRIEAFKRQRADRVRMSQATKIVMGTIGVSAVLAIALVLGLLLG